MFKPSEFFGNISKQVRNLPGTKDISIKFNIVRRTIPSFISGDKHRINYILLKLIKNSIERTTEANESEILVRCSLMNNEEVSLLTNENIVRLSDTSDL